MIFIAIAVLILSGCLAAGAAALAVIAYAEEALPMLIAFSAGAAVLLTAVGFSIAGVVALAG